jgi:hypothetical protein
MVLIFFAFGIYLSFSQLELFTGFLWLLELTIIFVFLLILFYINFKGYFSVTNINNIINIYKIIFYIYILFLNSIYLVPSELDCIQEFIIIILWENYYESLLNHNMNDFSLFLLSYYDFNSIELIIIGLILLIGSMVCVNLYKMNKNITTDSITPFISFFKLFKNSITFNFLRKQNLFIQNINLPVVKIINKKN